MKKQKRNISRVQSAHREQHELLACIEIEWECVVLLPNRENVHLSVWFRLSFLSVHSFVVFVFFSNTLCKLLLYFFLFIDVVVVDVVIVRSVSRFWFLFLLLCVLSKLFVVTLLLQLCGVFFVLVLSLFRRISVVISAVFASLSIHIMLSSSFLPYFCEWRITLFRVYVLLCLSHSSSMYAWKFSSERYAESARLILACARFRGEILN